MAGEASGSKRKEPGGAFNDPALFLPGAVMRVELTNFMTFTHCVFEPGPKLNLVLGPNGTGKSSLVCALCLGLASSTSILGRAEKVGEFVRRDASVQHGSIEITLKGKRETETHVITRRINKTTNGSEWKLNGSDVTMQRVKERVTALNIQLSNLCQFLPQDRVTAFAMMKPPQLLLETEKALGDATLAEQHTQLSEMRKAIKDEENAVKNNGEKLERLTAQNNALKRDVDRNAERDKILEEVELLKQKLPWAQYAAQNELYKENKEKLQEARLALQQKEKELAEVRKPIEKTKTDMEKAAMLVKEETDKAKTMQKNLRDLLAKNDALDDRAAEAREQLQQEKKEAEGFEKKKAKLAKDVTDMTRQLEDDPALQCDREAMAAAQDAKKKHTNEARNIKEEIKEVDTQLRLPERQKLTYEQKLQQLGTFKHKRTAALKNANQHEAPDVLEWVDRNRNNFKGQVFGPLAAEVKMKGGAQAELFSRYLETHVATNLWGAYVCTDAADVQAIRKQSLSRNWRMPVIHYIGDANAPLQRKLPGDQFRGHGVALTLDQTFDAPSIIKHVLCDNAGVSNVYCADPSKNWQDSKLVDAVLNDGCDCLFTPKDRIMKTTSRYNKSKDAVGSQFTAVRECRIFKDGAGAGGENEKAALEEAIANLNDSMKETRQRKAEYEKRLKACEKKEAEARQREDQVMKTSKRRITFEGKLKSAKEKLQRMKEPTDLAKFEKDTKKKLSNIALKRADMASRAVAIYVRLAEGAPAVDVARLEVVELKGHLDAAQSRMERARDSHTRAARVAEEVASDAQAAKKELRKCVDRAKEATGGELTDAHRTSFKDLPDNVDEIKDTIVDSQQRAQSVVLSNPDALQEYTRRAKEIATLEREREGVERRFKDSREKMDKVRDAWLPMLKKLIGRISAAYSRNFALIGCCGEVRLQEMGEDYEEYAAVIYVKFRDNEDMVPLTNQRQSGGERSVSTMLYLLSLQSLTATPFRVVDEINQGMDPNNERKIHQLLCRAATQKGTPQCFVLTPKLLADLEYNEDVTVMCIFNGPWIYDVAKGFSMDGFRKRVRIA